SRLWQRELGVRRTRLHEVPLCQHQRSAHQRNRAEIPLETENLTAFVARTALQVQHLLVVVRLLTRVQPPSGSRSRTDFSRLPPDLRAVHGEGKRCNGRSTTYSRHRRPTSHALSICSTWRLSPHCFPFTEVL